MSYELTAKILRHPLPSLTVPEKCVLAIIADMIDDKGYCFPSIGTLAKKAGGHVNTISRCVARLEKRGLLVIHREQGIVNRYYVEADILDKYIKQGKVTPTSKVGEYPLKGGGGYTLEGGVPHPKGGLVYKLKDNGKIKNGANSSNLQEIELIPIEEVEMKKKTSGRVEPTEGMVKDIDGIFFIYLKGEWEPWGGISGSDVYIPEQTLNLKVDDILKNANAGIKKPNKNISAKAAWIKHVIEWGEEGGKKLPPLNFTQKQAGQLNHAAKKISKSHEDHWDLIMGACVANWAAFVTYANLHTGKDSKPMQPDVGWFLVNSNLACAFYSKVKAKSDTKCKPKIAVTKKKLHTITDPETLKIYNAAFGGKNESED